MRSDQDESEFILTVSSKNASEFAGWCEAEDWTQADDLSQLLPLTRRVREADELLDEDRFPEAFCEARGKITPGTLLD